ncbi:hypothetical protein [Marinomonas profundimaris]|uniref:DinB-like domain-containing protein n=1 Tax=Marinomonas profundimaris TaxID=1208321 RepID=W1S2W3_9GAMM|nr:hypothetical protein [Marinomonas profundimaris]ETI62329.1 hypothetical protein D104_00855 [Marinomonas profundimaris]
MHSVLKKTENPAFKHAVHSSAIEGCLEVLSQASRCLEVFGDDDYRSSATPYVTSTIGEHFRHWLDVFKAIHHANYPANSVIDYNQRRRGHAIETSRFMAQSEIAELTDWLACLSESELKKSVSIITEVALSHTQACCMSSTLEREITFAALHANHHFAMIKVTANLMNKPIDADFGIAPATATFLRGQ